MARARVRTACRARPGPTGWRSPRLPDPSGAHTLSSDGVLMPWYTTSTTTFASRALAHTVICPPWGEQVSAVSVSGGHVGLRADTWIEAERGDWATAVTSTAGAAR